jgi:hypothetical protein
MIPLKTLFLPKPETLHSNSETVSKADFEVGFKFDKQSYFQSGLLSKLYTATHESSEFLSVPTALSGCIFTTWSNWKRMEVIGPESRYSQILKLTGTMQ